MNDAHIIKNLKKVNWSSEQIDYVMKKHLGKRTGMIEIPIDKLVKKFTGEDKKENKNAGNPASRGMTFNKNNFIKPAGFKPGVKPEFKQESKSNSNNNLKDFFKS
jgi:hypothetical protein